MSIKGYKDANGNIQKYDINSLDAPFTAEVGQVLVVESVDENGYPNGFSVIDQANGVEVTPGNPEKENTILTVNPDAPEIRMYTADDVDEGFVKKTDIATKSTAGIARIYGTGDKDAPGVGLTGNNILGIVRAKEEEINQKINASKPIVPSTLDYAVKSGLTTNALEWTEEEKQSARDLIGASDSGVEITDGEPTKESTVMTLNPNAEEVNLCTEEDFNAFKEEIDAKFDAFINAEEVAY